jgi:predicted metallopeptidase
LRFEKSDFAKINNAKEIKIKIYNIVHTGGKIFAGGLKTGFVNELNQIELYIQIFYCM